VFLRALSTSLVKLNHGVTEYAKATEVKDVTPALCQRPASMNLLK
jgi:hypothetical protein